MNLSNPSLQQFRSDPIQPQAPQIFRYSPSQALPQPIPQSHTAIPPILQSYSSMMKKCTWSIKRMLDQLVYIYREHGIRYPVQHLQDVLQRMLIPAQFRTLVDVAEVYSLVENKADLKDVLAVRGKYEPVSRDYGSLEKRLQGEIKDRFNTQLSNRFSQFNQDRTIRQRQPISRYEEHKDYYKKEHYEPRVYYDRYNPPSTGGSNYNGGYGLRENGRKIGVRSRGLEGHLCAWIVEEYEKGMPICRLDVIDKAREMGRDSNLKASVGWYSNFIRRNPQIREILAKGNVLIRKRQSPGSPQFHPKYQPYTKKEESDELSQMLNNIYDDNAENDDDEEEYKRELERRRQAERGRGMDMGRGREREMEMGRGMEESEDDMGRFGGLKNQNSDFSEDQNSKEEIIVRRLNEGYKRFEQDNEPLSLPNNDEQNIRSGTNNQEEPQRREEQFENKDARQENERNFKNQESPED